LTNFLISRDEESKPLIQEYKSRRAEAKEKVLKE
jgi:hypothetical protein